MGAEIDRLEVQVEAQAKSASQELDSLARKLNNVSNALKGINVGSLRNVAKEVGRVSAAMDSLGKIKAPNLSKTIAQLEEISKINLKGLDKKIRLDIEVNGAKEAGQLKYAIEKALDGVGIDTSRLSKQLIDGFNLKGAAAKQIREQMDNLAASLASSFDEKGFHVNDGVNAAMDEMAKNILENGQVARQNMDSVLGGIMEEYQEFYDYFNSHKIYVSDSLKSSVGSGEYKDLLHNNLRYMTTDPTKGINLNANWGELSSRFPSLISKDTVSDADQLLSVLEQISRVREGIKPVSIQELTGMDKGMAENSVWESVISSTHGLSDSLGKGIQSALDEAGSSVILDVKINEDKIVRDIKHAIERASSVKYDAVKVKLDIDSKNIENAVSEKLTGLDTGNLPQVASGMETISRAMASLNSISSKNAGLNSVVNSMRKLTGIDLSAFDTGKLTQITDAVKSLGTMPDVSNNANRLVSSLAKLAGAGAATGETAKALPELSKNLQDAVKGLSKLKDVSGSVNQFVQSVSQLANAGNKTSQTAAGMKSLEAATLSFMQAMTAAPAVSGNVLRMVEAISRLASSGSRAGSAAGSMSNAFSRISSSANSIGSKVKGAANSIKSALSGISSAAKNVTSKFASTVSSAFSKFTSSAKSVVSHAKQLGQNVSAAFQKIGGSSKHINTATFSLKNLFRQILPLLSIRQLFSWGKQAVELSSDLTEVENVVRGTFGDMSSKVDEFAQDSIRQFGMSELAVKQYASRFQAMGTAMGIDSGLVSGANEYLNGVTDGYVGLSDSMADVSLNLTKLTADMASFYNMEQSDVAEDLESIFTGQTRPLREYGLDLTQATLQEWALKNGLDADINSMSQAEKTMLRYQYVLANTSAAQGDFARTSGTWANQTRILAQSFQVLGTTIGSVLINVFKPVVSWLNVVMQEVISVVETIANALGAIFGWTVEVYAGGATADYDGMADGISGIGDAADGTAGSLGNAANQANELKKALLGFDEIEKLPDDTASSSGSGGSGSGSGSGSGAGSGGSAGSAQLVQVESVLEKYKSEIESLEELGEYIGDALTKAMKSIEWSKVYSAADNFGTGLAELLNGLISPELFDALGDTVAGCLNTALHALDSFGNTFDWANFGTSLGTGVNSFFQTWDANLTADVFSSFVNGLATTMDEAAKTIEFKNIGTKVGNCVKDALDGITWSTVYPAASGWGSGLADYLNGLLETPGLFDKIGTTAGSCINTALGFLDSFGTTFEWTKFGESLGTGLDTFLKTLDLDLAADTISTFTNGIADTIISGSEAVSWGDIGEKIATSMNKLLKTTTWTKVGTAVSTGINDMFKLEETWSDKFDFGALGTSVKFCINSALEKIEWENAITAASNIGNGVATALNRVMNTETFKDIGSTVANALNTVIAAGHSLISNAEWKKWGTAIGTGFSTLLTEFDWKNTIGDLASLTKGIFDGITYAVGSVSWSGIGEKLADAITSADWGGMILSAIGAALVITASLAETLISFGANLIKGLCDGISNALLNIGTWIKENLIDPIVDAVKEFFGIHSPSTVFEELGGFLIEGLLNGIKNIPSTLGDILIGVWEAIKTAWEGLGNVLQAGVELAKQGWETVTDWLGSLGDAAKGAIKAAVSLGKDGWDTVSSFVGNIGEKVFSLGKDGWDTVSSFVGSIGKKAFKLGKDGWETVSSFVGNIGKKAFKLGKDGWDTVSSFVGSIGKKAFKLGKDGWETVSSFVGSIGKKAFKLGKDGWDTVSSFVGNIGKKAFKLGKDGWDTVSSFVGEIGDKAVGLVKKAGGWSEDAWKALTSGNVSNTVKTALQKASTWVSDAWKALNCIDTEKVVTTALKKATEWASEAWDVLSSGATKTIEAGVSLAQRGWKTVKGWFEGLGSEVTEGDASIATGLIQDGWETVSGWLADLGEDVIGGFISIGVSIKEEAEKWWEDVCKWWEDETKNKSLEAYVKANPGSMAEDGETPEIEANESESSSTQKIYVAYENINSIDETNLPNETLPETTVPAKLDVTEINIPDALKTIADMTGEVGKVSPIGTVLLAGLSATIKEVTKANGINSLSDLGASILNIWKSGSPVLESVSATVGSASPLSSVLLAGLSATVSTLKKASGINSLDGITALTKKLGWTNDADKTREVEATTDKVDWMGAANKFLGVDAETDEVDWMEGANKFLGVNAKTSTVDWADKSNPDVTVNAETSKVGWTEKNNKDVAVNAKSDKVSIPEKSKTITGMTANFAKRTEDKDKVKAPYNLTANFAKRTTNKEKVTVPYSLTANFTKRTENKDKVKAPYNLLANFTNRKYKSSVTSPFNVKANFTDRSDNIPSSKKYISNITAYASAIKKSVPFSGLSLDASLSGISSLGNVTRLTFKKFGGIFSGGTWKPITAAAGGGAFNMGQMFVAREAGPELVGTIGGHTAVMNNDQIVSSVSAGVYQAVAAAMNQNRGNGQRINVNITLEGDAKGIFKVVKQENDRIVNATGRAALLT